MHEVLLYQTDDDDVSLGVYGYTHLSHLRSFIKLIACTQFMIDSGKPYQQSHPVVYNITTVELLKVSPFLYLVILVMDGNLVQLFSTRFFFKRIRRRFDGKINTEKGINVMRKINNDDDDNTNNNNNNFLGLNFSFQFFLATCMKCNKND